MSFPYSAYHYTVLSKAIFFSLTGHSQVNHHEQAVSPIQWILLVPSTLSRLLSVRSMKNFNCLYSSLRGRVLIQSHSIPLYLWAMETLHREENDPSKADRSVISLMPHICLVDSGWVWTLSCGHPHFQHSECKCFCLFFLISCAALQVCSLCEQGMLSTQTTASSWPRKACLAPALTFEAHSQYDLV